MDTVIRGNGEISYLTIALCLLASIFGCQAPQDGQESAKEEHPSRDDGRIRVEQIADLSEVLADGDAAVGQSAGVPAYAAETTNTLARVLSYALPDGWRYEGIAFVPRGSQTPFDPKGRWCFYMVSLAKAPFSNPLRRSVDGVLAVLPPDYRLPSFGNAWANTNNVVADSEGYKVLLALGAGDEGMAEGTIRYCLTSAFSTQATQRILFSRPPVPSK